MSRPHVPDAESRQKVADFSCAGFKHIDIAEYFDIDEKTLCKHYKTELKAAKMEKISKIGGNAFQMAMNGDQKMIEFVLKTQGRWSYAKAEDDKADNTNTLLEKLMDKL